MDVPTFVLCLFLPYLGIPGFYGYDLEVDIRLTPPIVQPLVTRNVSLRCSTNDFVPEGKAKNMTDSFQHNIARIRILKNFQETWRPIAQITDQDSSTCQILDGSFEGKGRGEITSKTDQRSFAEITWDLATADMFGNYKCDAIVFDDDQDTAYWSEAKQLKIGARLGGLDIVQLVSRRHENILGDVTAQQKEDTALLGKAEDKFQEAMANVKEQMKRFETDWKDSMTSAHKNQTARIEELEATLQIAIDNGFLMVWPKGTYGQLQASSGCPNPGTVDWKTGYHRHHTESVDRNHNAVSSDNHLKQTVTYKSGSNYFMYQHFCIKTDEVEVGGLWPKGTYCINKKGNCPSGFSFGSIHWDEEDTSHSPSKSGTLPDGDFDGGVAKVNYCCRKDAPHNTTIFLPNSDPFYLYRLEGRCQQVHGMKVTQEFMVFDTENDENDDKTEGMHPDIELNDVRLELCYYQKE